MYKHMHSVTARACHVHNSYEIHMQGTVFKYAFMQQVFPANTSFIIIVNMTLPLRCLLRSLWKTACE